MLARPMMIGELFKLLVCWVIVTVCSANVDEQNDGSYPNGDRHSVRRRRNVYRVTASPKERNIIDKSALEIDEDEWGRLRGDLSDFATSDNDSSRKEEKMKSNKMSKAKSEKRKENMTSGEGSRNVDSFSTSFEYEWDRLWVDVMSYPSSSTGSSSRKGHAIDKKSKSRSHKRTEKLKKPKSKEIVSNSFEDEWDQLWVDVMSCEYSDKSKGSSSKKSKTRNRKSFRKDRSNCEGEPTSEVSGKIGFGAEWDRLWDDAMSYTYSDSDSIISKGKTTSDKSNKSHKNFTKERSKIEGRSKTKDSANKNSFETELDRLWDDVMSYTYSDSDRNKIEGKSNSKESISDTYEDEWGRFWVDTMSYSYSYNDINTSKGKGESSKKQKVTSTKKRASESEKKSKSKEVFGDSFEDEWGRLWAGVMNNSYRDDDSNKSKGNGKNGLEKGNKHHSRTNGYKDSSHSSKRKSGKKPGDSYGVTVVVKWSKHKSKSISVNSGSRRGKYDEENSYTRTGKSKKKIRENHERGIDEYSYYRKKSKKVKGIRIPASKWKIY